MKQHKLYSLLSISAYMSGHQVFGSNVPSLSPSVSSRPSRLHHNNDTAKEIPPSNDMKDMPPSYGMAQSNISPSFRPSTADKNDVPKWKRRPSSRPSIIPDDDNDLSTSEAPASASNLPTMFTQTPTILPSINNNLPTKKPSRSPKTKSPTNSPTSHFPTTSPTSFPTETQSIDPTSTPSTYPSSIPSFHPSHIPTLEPSRLPSRFPTSAPSLSDFPSKIPSREPTGTPTKSAPPTTSHFPTSNPSLSHSPSLKLQSEFRNMTVSLMNFDMATLNNEDISIWEEITSVFISSYLQNFLSYISVHIDLRKQEFDGQQARSSHGHHNNALVMSSTIFILFRSESKFDVGGVIEDAFRTKNSRYIYRSQLADANPLTFADIEDISIQVSSGEGNVTNDPTIEYQATLQNIDDGTTTTSTIIMLVCGTGVAFIGLLIFGYRRVKHDTFSHKEKVTQEHIDGCEPNISAIIEVNDCDEVSDLGDPTIGEGDDILTKILDSRSVISLDDEPAKDVFDLEWNFSRVYGEEFTVSQSILGSVDVTLDTDNDSKASGFQLRHGSSFKTSLTIYAPSGELGIIIGTTNDFCPIIHAIKESSPLYDVLQVGDEIISFNDVDTTIMKSLELTKMIRMTYNYDRRKLTITRKEFSE